MSDRQPLVRDAGAAFSSGTIGSSMPDRIRTGRPASAASGGACNGTMARISTAPARTVGRSISIAAAMLAPLEKPSAIGLASP